MGSNRKPTVHFGKASVGISSYLIEHVEKLYSIATDKVRGRDDSESKGPHHTPLAIPAYILAVAAVEAFLNELYLSSFGEMILGVKMLTGAAKPLEQLDLRAKLLLVPHVAFGRALEANRQPYQNMTLLIQLRNELVHYKMGMRPPTAVNVLAQHGIAVRVSPEEEQGGPHPWAHRVSTLEGIRWAYNTACQTAVALLDLIPDDKRERVEMFRRNFREIP